MKEKRLSRAEMTADQAECYRLLCDLMGGEHHLEGGVIAWGDGIYYNQLSSIATFDFNLLTVAVILAHDRCIRLEVRPAGPRSIGLALHKRHAREGSMSRRHPTLETAVAEARSRFPQEADRGL